MKYEFRENYILQISLIFAQCICEKIKYFESESVDKGGKYELLTSHKMLPSESGRSSWADSSSSRISQCLGSILGTLSEIKI